MHEADRGGVCVDEPLARTERDGETLYVVSMGKGVQFRDYTFGEDGVLMHMEVSWMEAPHAVQKVIGDIVRQNKIESIDKTMDEPATRYDIVWKSIQTYDDGSVSRWIGGPDADNPAAVTKISKDAPRENAGGESGEAETEAPAAEATPSAESAEPAAAVTQDDDSPLPIILSVVALVLAAGAFILQVSRRKT